MSEENKSSSPACGMSLGEAASKASQEWCGPLTQNHDPAYWKSIREAYACGFMRGFNDCDSRKRASDREPVVSKTAEAKHVGISDLFGGFVVKIEPFMLWESARSQAMTSDNWQAAMLELEQALRRETTDTGSNRVYEMIDACLTDLQEKGVVRPMTDGEVDQDAECPLYPPNGPN